MSFGDACPKTKKKSKTGQVVGRPVVFPETRTTAMQRLDESRIEALANRLGLLEDKQQKDTQGLRFHIRCMAYFPMLDTYSKILKLAIEERPKKRRISKRSRTDAHLVAGVRSEAHRFGEMLESHRQMGDELNWKEMRFLDVFSKIDELCAKGIGNLRF